MTNAEAVQCALERRLSLNATHHLNRIILPCNGNNNEYHRRSFLHALDGMRLIYPDEAATLSSAYDSFRAREIYRLQKRKERDDISGYAISAVPVAARSSRALSRAAAI